MVSTMLDSPRLVSDDDSLRATSLSSCFCSRGNTVALMGATKGGKRNTLRASSPCASACTWSTTCLCRVKHVTQGVVQQLGLEGGALAHTLASCSSHRHSKEVEGWLAQGMRVGANMLRQVDRACMAREQRLGPSLWIQSGRAECARVQFAMMADVRRVRSK